ncbi:MAG: glutathione S-transferase [Halieaceae bacterium]
MGYYTQYMSYQLYQFPISHYCEKVRFALDYKGLEYSVKNLLPGIHARTTSKLGSSTSVPLLVCDGESIQGSAQIISFLDARHEAQPLTPSDPDLRAEAMAWEQWLDSQVGKDVRLYCYDTLLNHRDIVSGFFTSDGPWWGPLYLKFGYSKLVRMMREHMGITPESAEAALQRTHSALDRLCAAYAEHKYLVGNRFSRADLAAAALFAPMFQPTQYGLAWPEVAPEPLQGAMDLMSPRLDWARRIYADHR